MNYEAIVRADSLSECGQRLTTIEVTFPRYVLAEWNTHRVFSRNSASSRAIPVEKRIDAVRRHAFIPPFGKNQRGMQAGEDLADDEAKKAEEIWLAARDAAVENARRLANLDVHKQVANRLLEPFAWHTAICTSTVWENFLDQRDPERSPLADPAISPAARAVAEALESSTPLEMETGEWHLPYVDDEDWERLGRLEVDINRRETVLAKVSAARCARVSYLTHDGQRSMDADLDLYDRLVAATPMHASPLEHVATPCTCREYNAWPADEEQPALGQRAPRILRPDHRGNLRGWDQLRHHVEDQRREVSYR